MASQRQELIEARENVKRQIERLQNPLRPYDQYPEGVAKLRATLGEIERCIAELGTDDV
jgi:hypothetical protein